MNFGTGEEWAKGDERKPGKPKGNLGAGECVWGLWLCSVVLIKKEKAEVKGISKGSK